ncbi:uncharacterized protein PAN0_012d4441 [Moesziomyces antarcticus]|uniref:Uncharacterized protein n=1 Tax=Pseudozyma antarctica TaxID=84753 RepID=A0A081CHS3_PSEA2|nr:uncharacterized protein PAN0_012d4441 [Moesziomyces antarcticus]GAK66219.1 hypothetical protein PAN0_012d4441 [Moesziomyces antarcticus]
MAESGSVDRFELPAHPSRTAPTGRPPSDAVPLVCTVGTSAPVEGVSSREYRQHAAHQPRGFPRPPTLILLRRTPTTHTHNGADNLASGHTTAIIASSYLVVSLDSRIPTSDNIQLRSSSAVIPVAHHRIDLLDNILQRPSPARDQDFAILPAPSRW